MISFIFSFIFFEKIKSKCEIACLTTQEQIEVLEMMIHQKVPKTLCIPDIIKFSKQILKKIQKKSCNIDNLKPYLECMCNNKDEIDTPLLYKSIFQLSLDNLREGKAEFEKYILNGLTSYMKVPWGHFHRYLQEVMEYEKFGQIMKKANSKLENSKKVVLSIIKNYLKNNSNFEITSDKIDEMQEVLKKEIDKIYNMDDPRNTQTYCLLHNFVIYTEVPEGGHTNILKLSIEEIKRLTENDIQIQTEAPTKILYEPLTVIKNDSMLISGKSSTTKIIFIVIISIFIAAFIFIQKKYRILKCWIFNKIIKLESDLVPSTFTSQDEV